MPLRLEDWIIWDFWLAPRQAPADSFHLFFLQAPRSISDPEDRHNLATVGHAVSHDFRSWSYLGTALEPGSAGSWDDFTIWTGSVIHHGGRWHMFYTGRCRREDGKVQRVGLAMSDDLLTWSRFGATFLLEADDRWYRQSDCRDPWVLRHGAAWLMYFTVSDRRASRDRRGLVGLATSHDLINWEHVGPVTPSGHFGEVEVPQVVRAGSQWLMLFCTAKHSLERQRAGLAWNGSHYFIAGSPFGPFHLAPEPPLLADSAGTLYAARIVDDPWIEPCLLAWRRSDENGDFAGDIADPVPLRIHSDGSLSLSSGAPDRHRR